MGLLFPGRHKVQIDDQTVLRAKQDRSAREDLIAAHRDWVLKTAARICRRYIGEQDDQFSVALLAFDEAVTAYQCDRPAAFLTFAEQVIRRRLIDWQRRERRPEVVWSDLSSGDEDVSPVEQLTAAAAVQVHQQNSESEARREEIHRLDRELAAYGVTFGELVSLSPRHRDARVAAQQVALLLAGRETLLARMRRSKTLPLKELQQLVSVSRKTLERQRKYIIALTTILVGDYPMLRSFIEWPPGGGRHVAH